MMWDDPFGGDEHDDLLGGGADGLDEDGGTNDDELFFANKDCIIFLIDCHAAMFERNDRGEVPFHNAIKCAIATLTDKIISSENDLVGVCFYCTEKKNNPNDFEGIYLFQELDVPDAQRIMDLESLLRRDDFGTSFGHRSSEFPFCDALWTCSTMFSNCAVKVGHKRIFLFTNEDSPNSGNKNLREQSFQRAKDLMELGIDIELFSMNKPGEHFDPSLFYQHIISVSEDEDTGVMNFDASSKFEELRARVRRKEFKKRAINRLSLLLGDDIEIAVRLYNLVQPTKKGQHIWLDAKTNQPLKSVTKWICADTGTLLMDSQVKYSFPFGGEKVVFDKDEAIQLRTLEKKGLRILGFKPRSAVKPHLNISHSSFIYPDEQQVQGSTVAFSALLDRLIASDKVGICLWTRRNNTAPRIVAMLPQEEELDEEGLQINPPGFHLIPLPFADDIRHLTTEPPLPATPDQVIKAKKVVKALRINFDSRSFENPALQRHYANLQALALDRDTVEETPDYLLPDTEGMENFVELIKDFKEAVFSPDYDELRSSKAKTGTKRKREPTDEDNASEGDNSRSSKKALVVVDAAYVEELRQTNELTKLTVPQIKEFLQREFRIVVPAKLRKPQLLELLQGHLSSRESAGEAAKSEPSSP